MKKSLLFVLILIAGAISAQAETINDFFNRVKASAEFSAMSLTKEQARESLFDSMDVAISETVSAATVKDLRFQLALLPAAQKITETEDGTAFVAIYSQPLSGGKALVLLVVLNGKNGCVIKGITDQAQLDKGLSGLHMNTLFGD